MDFYFLFGQYSCNGDTWPRSDDRFQHLGKYHLLITGFPRYISDDNIPDLTGTNRLQKKLKLIRKN